jgi:hypothetical protein
VTENILGQEPKSNSRDWFDEECKVAVEERNTTYRSYVNRPMRLKQIEYEHLRRKADKTCSKKKRAAETEHVQK